MMNNLFSVFDPTSYWGLYMNWMILLFVFLFMPFKYYFIKSNYYNVYMMISFYFLWMFNEVATSNMVGLNLLCLMTFMYLMISNLLGLFPFIFTSSAHIMFTLGLSFVLWMAFFSMGWMKNFKKSAAHLVPEGSPLMLSPLLVMIESISHFIRPFTLAIRLTANMMAGHLIIGLLSSISMLNMGNFILSMIFQSFLMILEFGVAVIQAFVFSILILLYALEYY